jgi:hypothetical protein
MSNPAKNVVDSNCNMEQIIIIKSPIKTPCFAMVIKSGLDTGRSHTTQLPCFIKVGLKWNKFCKGEFIIKKINVE